MNPRFLRQVRVLAILGLLADIFYRVFMGVLYGIAIMWIFYPLWS